MVVIKHLLLEMLLLLLFLLMLLLLSAYKLSTTIGALTLATITAEHSNDMKEKGEREKERQTLCKSRGNQQQPRQWRQRVLLYSVMAT